MQRYLVPQAEDVRRLYDTIEALGGPAAAIESAFKENASPWVAEFDPGLKAILNSTAEFFCVDRDSVRIVGSAQFGYSLLNLQPFCPGISDLDIAVIDEALFLRVQAEIARDNTSERQGPDTRTTIRPDMFIGVPYIDDWLAHFAGLQKQHAAMYANITVLLFPSTEVFFAAQRIAFESFYTLFKFRGLVTPAIASPFVKPGEGDGNVLQPFSKFPQAVKDSIPANSAPQLVGLDELRERFKQGGRRRALLDKLANAIEACPRGLNLHYMLASGSFFDARESYPRDMDGAIYYSLSPEILEEHAWTPMALLSALRRVLSEARIDAKLVPLDSDPLHMIRLTAFVSNLFAQSRDGGPSASGMALIRLKPDAGPTVI